MLIFIFVSISSRHPFVAGTFLHAHFFTRSFSFNYLRTTFSLSRSHCFSFFIFLFSRSSKNSFIEVFSSFVSGHIFFTNRIKLYFHKLRTYGLNRSSYFYHCTLAHFFFPGRVQCSSNIVLFFFYILREKKKISRIIFHTGHRLLPRARYIHQRNHFYT